jgi:hypothetical protein
VGHGVDGVVGALAADFEVAEGEVRLAVDGQADHLGPVVGVGQRNGTLVRRPATGNENDLVKAELLDGRSRNDQVAVVDRVEAAAEQSDALGHGGGIRQKVGLSRPSGVPVRFSESRRAL